MTVASFCLGSGLLLLSGLVSACRGRLWTCAEFLFLFVANLLVVNDDRFELRTHFLELLLAKFVVCFFLLWLDLDGTRRNAWIRLAWPVEQSWCFPTLAVISMQINFCVGRLPRGLGGLWVIHIGDLGQVPPGTLPGLSGTYDSYGTKLSAEYEPNMRGLGGYSVVLSAIACEATEPFFGVCALTFFSPGPLTLLALNLLCWFYTAPFFALLEQLALTACVLQMAMLPAAKRRYRSHRAVRFLVTGAMTAAISCACAFAFH